MQFLKEYYEYNMWKYDIGSEVILTDIINDEKCYTIDNIREIVIKKDSITYYFEEAQIGVLEEDIIPYSTKKENELLHDGYGYIGAYSFY